ncbi:MAG: 2OG-Fe(II) oxygenase [Planctomycetota bacterium]|nr:MAG: 2OG-Fe(II) oxygenase [Planctomycetota bacterium]REK24472.1 MAG: 2OG-Fe(II) oxygenase [Planctomycetota bacterium]REK38661.1 MAG: 2OG-Fe(II) oxygenase [Planctomycetota bacterium]
MKDSSTVEWLAEAIVKATRSARYCVAGCLPAIDPDLEVAGVGRVPLPLKRGMAKQLIASCRVAPYGKGTRTLVNKKVRNTFELDPKKFQLGEAWNSAIADAMPTVAQQLGLPADQLESRLYKLLIYKKGGFFLPHRDSEKQNRMVASLIVVLPNSFEGGNLIVRHGAVEQRLTFDEAAAGKSPCFAAFYADCEHEIRRVTRGVRIALAYNLVLKPQRGKSSATAKPTASIDALAGSIESWVAMQPAQPLVFALEHHYTQRGLSLELLKGDDRKLADLVASAAEKADCLVHLAQVQRHLQQWADDGSFAHSYRGRYDRTPRNEIEIGETYEDELSGTHWTDVRGRKQPWGAIAFDLSAIVSSVPLEDWKPTSEEFEGYTGNAGNTLDRWYHRSAIVVWHRDHHFDVIASSGAAESVPLFCSMAARLVKTPKKRLEEARRDCLRFARAIIARWPHRTFGYGPLQTGEKSPLDDFPQHLLLLHDRDTVAMFLSKLAEQDQSLPLKSFVVDVCREFGWNAFARELKHLLSATQNIRGRQEVPFRDIEWLSAFCCDKTADPDKSALAEELCALAVARFCEARPPRSPYFSPYHRRESSVSEKSLPLLLKALLAGGREEGLSRVVRVVQQSPDEFRLDDCQIPSLKQLIPWSGKQLGQVHPQLETWLISVRQQLESATAKPPTPPTDWARPAEVDCKCQFCAQLNAFLADPANEVGRIPAREDARQHLVGMIVRHQCDVKHTLQRKGSPYSLVLTKTTGSFDRAVKRFEADHRLLKTLPPAS